jgi:DNA-directed RNA polymerase subunit RPC12/RpoP
MPAPAFITCPTCQKRFKGKPELGGKKIKCPLCAEPFVVPHEIDVAKAAAKPPKTKPAPPPPPSSDNVEAPADDAAYGVGTIDTTPRCPNCAKEMLSADAVICVHCGYNTLTRVHGETKKLVAATAGEHFLYLLPALSGAAVFLIIIVTLVFYDTVLTVAFEGSKMTWITHESLRMWSTIFLLGLLWGIGTYAFNTLVLRPKPPDVEKE